MNGPTVLAGARLVDGRGLRHSSGDLIIDGTRIVAIGVGDRPRLGHVINLEGLTIVPGLVNAHTHLCLDGGPDPSRTLSEQTPDERRSAAIRRLEGTLLAGVTTIRDLGGVDGLDLALAAEVESGAIVGPRIRASGNVITSPRGHGHWIGVQVKGPSEARRATSRQLRRGAASIKLMATGGMMTGVGMAGAPQLSVDEMRAATDVAHASGVPVAAHAESRLGVIRALSAGVDSIEHGHGGDAEAIDLLLEAGSYLVPTILSDRRIIEEGVAAGTPQEIVDQCAVLADQLVPFLEAAIRAGVRVAAGNDGGAPLVGLHEIVAELELYVEHGMTPQAAIAAATSTAADLLRLPAVGRIEVGCVADLVVLRDDPLVDIRALASPIAVMKGGEFVWFDLPSPTGVKPERRMTAGGVA